MKLYVVLGINVGGTIVQRSFPHTVQELPLIIEDYMDRDDVDRCWIDEYTKPEDK